MARLSNRKAIAISVINMKGGVGKTTLTCNIGVELAETGNKVLMIDIDPQFNTTQTLFKYYYGDVEKYRELENEEKTLFGIFNYKKNIAISKENEEEREYVYSLGENIDIIPGDLRLIMEINNQTSDIFKAYINMNNLKEKYDYIIIDCPPTWGTLTNLALDISDYYLIPSKLDEFSTVGITLLGDLVKTKINALDRDLKCLGVVYMMLNETDSKTGIARSQKQIKEEIEVYFKTMSKYVRSEVKSFETVFYYSKSMATESVIYKASKSKKKISNVEKIRELVKDIETIVKYESE